MSKLQEIPTFLPNKSIVLNKPEEFLLNNYSTDKSRNMENINEELSGRLGLLKFDSAVLSGPILLEDQFWKYDATLNFIICTTKDIYKYDFDSEYYEIITPISIGTGNNSISIGTGTAATVVTGVNCNFTTEGIKEGDYIKIGTGNLNTDATWYEIGTGNSSTELNLTSAATEVSTSQYTIRKCFAGTSSDKWNAVTFQDTNLGEQWIATNGVDTPVRYGGSDQVIDLINLPTGFVSAKYIEVYKDRVIFLHTIEVGNQPQRERWSGVANCVSWDDLDLLDFMESGYWITGSLIWNGYHIVFREGDAMVGRWVGGTSVFSYESNNSCNGVKASKSISFTSNKIYYYGADNRFHSWNLVTEDDISYYISSYVNNFDSNKEKNIFSFHLASKYQIRWFVPYGLTDYMNACIVWDYLNENIYIWEYEQAQACNSIGEYVLYTDSYVDTSDWSDYYVDEQEGFWNDKNFLENAPILVYGGDDGYLRHADIGYTDDGTSYSRVFESTRQNFKYPNLIKRLYKQQHWLKSDISGSVKVSLKTDDKLVYGANTNSISLIDNNRDIIKKNITWNRHGENFKTRIEATNHFSILGWLNYIYIKGNTNR